MLQNVKTTRVKHTDITEGICIGPGRTGTVCPLGSIIIGYGPVGDLKEKCPEMYTRLVYCLTKLF